MENAMIQISYLNRILLNGDEYTKVELSLEGFIKDDIAFWTMKKRFPELELFGQDAIFDNFGYYEDPNDAIEAVREKYGCLFIEKINGNYAPYSNLFYVYLKNVKDPFEEYLEYCD